MMRTLHTAVATAMLAAAATSAAAEILTVTTTVDDELRAGSLRAVLDRALPGDEIVFDVLRPVVLERRIDVVVDELIISGPVTITSQPVVGDLNTKRKLSVLSSDVTITGIEFDSVVLRVGETAQRCTIVGSFFHGRGGKLFLEGATDTTVGTVELPNRFLGLRDPSKAESAVLLTDDVRTRIVGNSFDGANTTVETVFSVDLVVDGNRFQDAGVSGHPESATIEGNDIRLPIGGRHGDGVNLQETPRHAQPGMVEVLSNRIRIGYGTGGISVGRSNAVVRDNTVRAPAGRGSPTSGIVVSAGHSYFPAESNVVIEDNRIRGGTQGLLVVSENEHEPTFVIRNNRIRHVRGTGLSIVMPESGTATVTDNVVRRGRKAPSGSQAFLGSRGGEITFERNLVARGAAPSVEVQLIGGSALIADCKIAKGPTHAVRVLAGEGTLYARTNVIQHERGDAYHFESGSRGVVSLLGSLIKKVKGAPLHVAEGADVEQVD